MSMYRQQIRKVLQATHIHSEVSYSWFGHRSLALSGRMRRVLTPSAVRSYLLYTLHAQLYADFYCNGGATPMPLQQVAHQSRNTSPFVQALSAANTGHARWDADWQVSGVAGQEIRIRKGKLELCATTADTAVEDARNIQLGDRIRIRREKELRGVSPGFYMALGDQELVTSEVETLVRLYWHVTPEGSVPLIQVVTRLLNDAAVPFQLKVVNDPTRFTRCDASVLYLRKCDFTAASALIVRVYREVAEYLAPSVPALTKSLAPGLALAEDPVPRDSFGMHRCRILADGLIRAHEQGAKSLAARSCVVEECLAEARINLDAPFLNPHSEDIYEFTASRSMALSQTHSIHEAMHERRAETAATYLGVALQIGMQLVSDAIWYGEHCTWIGLDSGSELAPDPDTGLTYRTLGPEVYGGTSGIALFLAELSAVTGDEEIRRAAAGALRQTLANASADLPSEMLGMYSGWPGVALVVAHAAAVLRSDELLEAVKQFIELRLAGYSNSIEHDLVFGKSGGIVALLGLRQLVDDPTLLDAAMLLGDQLLDGAQRRNGGYSWRWDRFPFPRNLTGLSHGAAGIGWALLELAIATGESRFREAAELAFAYERYWFDAASGNWPDFRMSRGGKVPASFFTRWCHGAPGIALSRVRAYELTNNTMCKTEAETALASTRMSIERELASNAANYSLCHGLAGNAAILVYASRALTEANMGSSENMRLARAVADYGVAISLAGERPWRCGTHTGRETPGLMLGLAGIGYFYLCMNYPELPSVLLPHPGQWRIPLPAPITDVLTPL